MAGSPTKYYEGFKVIKELYDERDHILTRYVEKPVEEVRIVEVPKITYVDVVKQVPDIQVKTVEKEVEELFIDEVIQEVPIVREEEIIKQVPVKKVVQVPVEHVREVKVDQMVTREQIIEVPGEIIEVEKHFQLQQPVIIPNYRDNMRPMVYQQLVKPILHVASGRSARPEDTHCVETFDYDPVLCKVLIHIPKPVKQPVIALGPTKTDHQWMGTVKDYDHLVRRCNPHLNEQQLTGLITGDSLLQPIPDTSIGGLPIIGGNAPLPGVFAHSIVPPIQMPKGKPIDPKPILNATYVNGIAREVSNLRHKQNPNFIPAIHALKELRKYKYNDPKYERYLKEHHMYFSDVAKVVTTPEEASYDPPVTARSPPRKSPSPTHRTKGASTSRLPEAACPPRLFASQSARGYSTSRAHHRIPARSVRAGPHTADWIHRKCPVHNI